MRTHLTAAAISLLTIACAGGAGDETDTSAADTTASMTTGGGNSVTTTVRDANGRDLGTLTLTDGSGGVSISGTLTGLPPGEHGLHLHMVGRCDAPGFESAGDHWNPTSKQPGSQNPQGPHLGDMPNVTAGADSSATVQATTPGGMLRGATDMLLDADGAAVVIHASPDDYLTDPSGGSGARIACGMISGM